ncbi:MAG TPA: hypothetical protein VNO70_12990 [Blastocatellia bacterium]|nr:hypothetical protein [Blastocatellia bacterium]
MAQGVGLGDGAFLFTSLGHIANLTWHSVAKAVDAAGNRAEGAATQQLVTMPLTVQLPPITVSHE